MKQLVLKIVYDEEIIENESFFLEHMLFKYSGVCSVNRILEMGHIKLLDVNGNSTGEAYIEQRED